MPVSKLGVTTKLADRLSLMGIESVLDVLQHYPRRYHDRTVKAEIAELAIGQEATIFAEVRRIATRRSRQGRAIVDAAVYDGTSLLNVVFFNQAWRERQLPIGTEAAFFGKVEQYQGKRQLTNPVVDVLGKLGENTGTVVPVYPQSGKADVFTWQLRKIVASALDWVRGQGGIADPLDEPVRRELKLMERGWSLEKVHQPADLEESRRAQRRLRFDEFLRMQVGLVARKRAIEAEQQGIRHTVAGDGAGGALVSEFHAGSAVPAHRRPATDDRRDPRRHGVRRADAPLAPGRRRLGQDGRRAHRAPRGGAGWLPGRAHGADRGARRAALPLEHRDARRLDGQSRGHAHR